MRHRLAGPFMMVPEDTLDVLIADLSGASQSSTFRTPRELGVRAVRVLSESHSEGVCTTSTVKKGPGAGFLAQQLATAATRSQPPPSVVMSQDLEDFIIGRLNPVQTISDGVTLLKQVIAGHT